MHYLANPTDLPIKANARANPHISRKRLKFRRQLTLTRKPWRAPVRLRALRLAL